MLSLPLCSTEDLVQAIATERHSVRVSADRIQEYADMQYSLIYRLKFTRKSLITSGITKMRSSPVPSADLYTSAPAYTFFTASS